MKKFLIAFLTLLFAICALGLTACGFLESVGGNSHRHNHVKTIIIEPTCTEEGTASFTCICGSSYEGSVDALGHEFTEYISNGDATLDVDGTKTATCNREGCSETDTVVDLGSMLSHVHDFQTVITEPTCTEEGYTTYTCFCGNEYEADFVKELGHDWDEGVLLNNLEKGNAEYKYTCKECSETEIKIIKLYSFGLQYGTASIGTGYSVKGIGECEDTEIVIPEKHEGLPVVEIAEKAFYQNTSIVSVSMPNSVVKIGNKAFSECEKLVDVDMPHDVEVGIDVFRASIKVNLIIHHVLEFVPAKDATCEEPGNIAYYSCVDCDLCYEDGKGEVRLYDVIIAPSHNFISGQCTKCGQIQNEVKIVSIDSIADLGKFPLGTLETAIGLPEKINVKTADNQTHELKIVWNMATYNKSVVGAYTIVGHIQANEFYFAEGLTNKVSTNVEIVEKMKGTADIVFVLDVSGSMGDEIATVKNNLKNFAQAIEDEGVSARWSVITYSDFEEYPTDKDEQTQCIMNGASYWYTDADSCKSAINSIQLAGGGDWEEVAIDGLMMADSLQKRQDARVFYILLTDADYKTANHYGVSNMGQAVSILDASGANVSVITSTDCYTYYSSLTTTTGGVLTNINGNFSQALLESLVPIIYENVIA